MKLCDPALFKKIKDRCRLTEDECWEWMNCRQANGYGRINHNRVSDYVHRLMYIAVHGAVQRKRVIHQTCGNRACANPEHLVARTKTAVAAQIAKENGYANRVMQSLARRGERCHAAKLTQAQVDQIRAQLANDVPTKVVAERFGIGVDNVRRIRRFDTWRTGFMSILPPKKSEKRIASQ